MPSVQIASKPFAEAASQRSGV